MGDTHGVLSWITRTPYGVRLADRHASSGEGECRREVVGMAGLASTAKRRGVSSWLIQSTRGSHRGSSWRHPRAHRRHQIDNIHPLSLSHSPPSSHPKPARISPIDNDQRLYSPPYDDYRGRRARCAVVACEDASCIAQLTTKWGAVAIDRSLLSRTSAGSWVQLQRDERVSRPSAQSTNPTYRVVNAVAFRGGGPYMRW